ncbi:hypothetical protein GYA13_01475 [Candidatus Kuenenbacteria bacterium]|nr:hypothetical protein [Candidatus Kuenenbacteria bacterium]
MKNKREKKIPWEKPLLVPLEQSTVCESCIGGSSNRGGMCASGGQPNQP